MKEVVDAALACALDQVGDQEFEREEGLLVYVYSVGCKDILFHVLTKQYHILILLLEKQHSITIVSHGAEYDCNSRSDRVRKLTRRLLSLCAVLIERAEK